MPVLPALAAAASSFFRCLTATGRAALRWFAPGHQSEVRDRGERKLWKSDGFHFTQFMKKENNLFLPRIVFFLTISYNIVGETSLHTVHLVGSNQAISPQNLHARQPFSRGIARPRRFSGFKFILWEVCLDIGSFLKWEFPKSPGFQY